MWRKSSRSNTGGNGNCVEVSLAGRAARVRDSKNPAGPTVALSSWTAFVAAVKNGAYDR
ncbi:DUF397 domain-containing protein [Saccharothrix sp. S26]|uniref:DUF397 domain-containing protein n=1 Tax=Saccharothrix sp. S26 TaxID=2907215 RepID=UPI001F305841|nr:DUF397 domain-containing protein [Saccharothrix sp. S26]MCE6997012.1 DUF397 domain-containing protein [Saccharothrix sp. S26]